MKIILRRKDFKSHCIVWLLFLIFTIFANPNNGSYIERLLYNGFRTLNLVIFFYILILYVFNLWDKHKTKCIIGYLLSYSLFLILPYIRWYFFLPLFFVEDGQFWMKPEIEFFKKISLNYILLSIIGITYYLRKINLHKIELQNLHNKSLLVKEVNFYKTQFNPHITFNFLNYTYSKANRLSEEVAHAIELYSDMLRYTTKQKSDKMVYLKDELEYIENYIALKKLLSKPCYVCFSIKGDTKGIQLYPRILLSLIENAFKHGAYTESENPIEIILEVIERKIILTVKNLIDTSNKILSTGVGQKNLKQSLKNYYNDKHILVFEMRDDLYYSKLVLEASR